MPRPLLIAFAVVALATLVVVTLFLIKPPKPPTLPVASRLLPPSGSYDHDPGGVAGAPRPSTIPPFAPACSALKGVSVEAGVAGQQRVALALRDLCGIAGPGVPDELRQALAGLNGVAIRFAGLERTGEDAVSDLSIPRLYLNVRFARHDVRTDIIGPILVHEGWHLAHRTLVVDARQEFFARVAEADACRLLIPKKKWVRNCTDADALVAVGETRAVALLEQAGYAKP